MIKSDSQPLSYEKALLRATSLCSTSEHCISEMERKFSQWGVSPSDSERAISYLIDEKYIDERRFARAYTLDKLRYNGWGRVKIQLMLRQLRIQDNDISLALQEIPEDEYSQILRNLISQKNRSLHDTDDYQKRGTLIRFALQRGFDMQEILDVIPEK